MMPTTDEANESAAQAVRHALSNEDGNDDERADKQHAHKLHGKGDGGGGEYHQPEVDPVHLDTGDAGEGVVERGLCQFGRRTQSQPIMITSASPPRSQRSRSVMVRMGAEEKPKQVHVVPLRGADDDQPPQRAKSRAQRRGLRRRRACRESAALPSRLQRR